MFIARERVGVPINRNQVLSGTNFGVQTIVGNQRTQLNFAWNSDYQYYSVDILRDNNSRAIKFYAEPDEFHLVRNFDPESRKAPDVKVGIITAHEHEDHDHDDDILPETLGKVHFPHFLRGIIADI